MISHLDEEILTEILKRLPVKLLLRLRCVSKSWYILITKPSFIAAHTTHSLLNKGANDKLLLRHYSWIDRREKYTVHFDSPEDSSFGECCQELGFSFKSYSQYFEIVGSCNGLLCLSDTYRINSHTIILWNPTIKKSVTLPMPRITLDRIYMFVLGFGFDSRTNDYKVVRVVYRIGDHGIKVLVAPKVELYELSKNSWRNIDINITPRYVISELSLQVYLNGSVHWIGYNPNEAGSDFKDLSLVLFDMSNEGFTEMKLPESVTWLSVLDLSIGVCGERLSLIQYNRHTDSQWIQYGSCCIWMMKEYGVIESWTKQYCIDLQGGVRKALGVRKNGNVFVVSSSGELVSYDLQSKGIHHLGIKGVAHSFFLDAYVESLVLLKFFNELATPQMVG